MDILLDSHILIWALTNDQRLSDKARACIMDPDNTIFYSAVSVWELTMKHLLYPDEITFSGEELMRYCEDAGYEALDLTGEAAALLASLSRPKDAPRHKDPFDRMLICQANAENMLFLTHDELLPYYHEPCIVSV